MKIRVEGTPEECSAMAAVLKTVFDVKSVSKFYPNARNSVADFDGRQYVTLSGFAEKDAADILVADMLKLLDRKGRMSDGNELARVRQIHEIGKRGLALDKLMALYFAWRDDLMK